MRRRTGVWLAIGGLLAVSAVAQATPLAPAAVLGQSATDTVRTNLMVAEALLADALSGVMAALPAQPATVVLVPGSREQAANLLTTVATHRLLAAGHQVHLDGVPPGTTGAVYELRYRVDQLDLLYPDSGRRFMLWRSWVDRQVDLVVQFTLVDATDGQVIASERAVRRFNDRVEADQVAAIEQPLYSFTRADVDGGGWTRRLEEIVVLGSLAGLVAIYFANTE